MSSTPLSEVEKRVMAIVERSKDPSVSESLRGFSKVVALDFPDLGLSYALHFEDGSVKRVESGVVEEADIRVSLPSSTFVNIVDKKTSPVKEYQLGKLKVKGSLSDLLKLRKLLF